MMINEAKNKFNFEDDVKELLKHLDNTNLIKLNLLDKHIDIKIDFDEFSKLVKISNISVVFYKIKEITQSDFEMEKPENERVKGYGFWADTTKNIYEDFIKDNKVYQNILGKIKGVNLYVYFNGLFIESFFNSELMNEIDKYKNKKKLLDDLNNDDRIHKAFEREEELFDRLNINNEFHGTFEEIMDIFKK